MLVLNKRDLRGRGAAIAALLRSHAQDCCRTRMWQPAAPLHTGAAPRCTSISTRSRRRGPAARLAAILHAEGEELIADNILLQCRHLDDRGRLLLTQQRRRQARRCVDRYSWIGAGIVAATPLPGVDLLGTAAVNAQMVMELAGVYGIELSKDRAKELAMSVGRTLAGLGAVKGAISLIGSALSLSLPTLMAGRMIQGVVAAWLTRVAGSSFIRYFEQDQDWGDGGMRQVVQEQFNLNRREASLKRFLDAAMRQVVEPLQRAKEPQLPPRPEPPAAADAWDPAHPEG